MNTPLKILLVEDERDFAGLLRNRLIREKNPPFQVIHAPCVRGAVEILAKRKMDAVLLDLSLPDSSGLDTLATLYAQAPAVPMVILTASEDEALAIEAVKKGAQDYLIKGKSDGKDLPRILKYAVVRHEKQAEFYRLSLADELTGLRNRRGFIFLAEQQIKLTYRTGEELLLFYIDLDGLKHMNDTLGHFEGDRALQAVAQVLKKSFRNTDVVARVGGDEFMVLAIDAGMREADLLSGRLHRELKNYNHEMNFPCPLSISVGAVPFRPDQPCTLEALIGRADQAMYEQKRRRKALIGEG